MKCKAIIIRYKKGRGKITLPNGDIAKAINYILSTWPKKDLDKLDFDHIEICQGKIVANIRAEDEPYFGGTSATLEARFKCDTCGHEVYPDLPTPYTLNDWINKLLDNQD